RVIDSYNVEGGITSISERDQITVKADTGVVEVIKDKGNLGADGIKPDNVEVKLIEGIRDIADDAIAVETVKAAISDNPDTVAVKLIDDIRDIDDTIAVDTIKAATSVMPDTVAANVIDGLRDIDDHIEVDTI